MFDNLLKKYETLKVVSKATVNMPTASLWAK